MDELSDGVLTHLGSRDTAFVLVSRAPLARLQAYAASRGWTVPWYFAAGSDFNYDFGVTVDAEHPEYNYRPEPGVAKDGPAELPGVSCFLRDGGDIFHTYSTYARGSDQLGSTYTLLDLTALGRQEDWEEPKGRAPTRRRSHLHGLTQAERRLLPSWPGPRGPGLANDGRRDGRAALESGAGGGRA